MIQQGLKKQFQTFFNTLKLNYYLLVSLSFLFYQVLLFEAFTTEFIFIYKNCSYQLNSN